MSDSTPKPVTHRFLTSWPYLTGGGSRDKYMEAFARYDNTEVLIDSGAFTFYKTGQSKTVKEYAAFLRGLEIEPVDYFQLDVIGDAEATLRNYREMLDMGLRPVPIWTRGAPIEHFHEMADTADYVGVGGIAVGSMTAGEGVRSYLRWLHHEVMRPGDAVHWLGVAKHKLLNYYLPRQCDTTTWLTSSRWLHWRSYYGGGRWGNELRGAEMGEPLSRGLLVRDYMALRETGYDIDAVINDRELRNEASVAQHLRYATDLAMFGTKMFFATASPLMFLLLLGAYERGRDVGLYA